MPSDESDDHPIGDGLQLSDDDSAAELQEFMKAGVDLDEIPGISLEGDLRLGKIVFCFVDENGMVCEHTATAEQFDSEVDDAE